MFVEKIKNKKKGTQKIQTDQSIGRHTRKNYRNMECTKKILT